MRFMTALVILFLLFISYGDSFSAKGEVNRTFLNSIENATADIIITETPTGLISKSDLISIRWMPESNVTLRYSAVPGGGDAVNYPSSLASGDLQKNVAGEIQFYGNKLPAGLNYCILTSGSDLSAEFILIRESAYSPTMINPKTGEDDAGITTNSPIFTWEEVNGVPFYHILLSDQPFTVDENEEGTPITEGANIIWQVVTNGNSIPYGTQDPSGHFTITSPPPLVKGVRYNWIVLNNYANNPALTSSVTGGPVGFNVNVEPPFETPVNIEPAHGSATSASTITFEWSEIEGASLYHVYVSRMEDVRGSQALMPVWEGITTDNLVDLSSSILQLDGKYLWKVLAQDERGNGAMGDTTSFYFSSQSAMVNFYAYDLRGNRLPRTKLQIESLDYGANPMVLPTDDDGFLDRIMPLGSYRVLATKEGFEDTSQTFEVVSTGITVNIRLRPSQTSVFGSTKDANGNAIAFTTILATISSGGEEKETTSDINGNFVLSLSSYSWYLVAKKDGYASSATRSVNLSTGANLDLNASENGGPFVLTKNAFLLNGQITTPSSEAIWNATITATYGSEQEVTNSDAQGRFSLMLGAGNWSVEVAKAGYVSPNPRTVQIIDQGASLNLTLTPKANLISGTVNANGVPLKAATVQAIPNTGQAISTTTDDYGQYTLSLSSGTFQIAPVKTGYISPDPSQFTLTVGQTISGVDFNLEPENCYITGIVTTNGVTPLSGALVTNGTKTTTTNTSGRYTLGVLAGTYTVRSSKEGYMSGTERKVTLTPGQTLSGINFTLTPNASVISGYVTSGSSPVYDVQVLATHSTSGNQLTAKTNTSGYYTVSGAAGTYSVVAQKQGFIPTPTSLSVTVAPGQTRANQNFSLKENISYVSGVITSNSLPLRNVTVKVTSLKSSPTTFTTVTGVNGNFNVAVTPGYRYEVVAVKTGYYTTVDTTTTLVIEQKVVLALGLSPQQSLISGLITKADNTVLADAVIKAANASKSYSTKSGPAGKYSLGLDAGTYVLSIQKSGYISKSKDLTISVGDTLKNQNFKLEPNFASLSGNVTDDNSDGVISGALVVATEMNTQSGGSAYTDDFGNYLIKNLPPGIYQITVTHQSYLSSSISSKGLAGGLATQVNFSLAPKDGKITGTVTQSGSGMENVTITASGSDNVTYTVTETDGSYSISDISPGDYTVQASLNGYSSSATVPLSVDANQTGQANFTVVPNEGMISGFVRTGGSPLSGATVTAVSTDGNSGSAVTETDGSYSISHIATDTYTVTVKCTGYLSTREDTTISIGAGASVNLDLTMERSIVNISGQVVDQAGTPLPNIPLSGESPLGSQDAVTGADGRFSLTSLAPNTSYQIKTKLYQEGYENSQVDVPVERTDVSNVKLTVNIYLSKMRGSVGQTGVTITAKNLDRDITTSAASQPDGSFSLKKLYNGNYRITAQKVGYRISPAEINITGLGVAEDRAIGSFSLTEIKISISGKVVNQYNEAVSGVSVLVWSASASKRATTGADGTYSISDLPPNLEYTIQTELEPLEYDNHIIQVTAGESNVSNANLSIVHHDNRISGLITSNENSTPLRDVLITLAEVDSSTMTDAEGHFQFDYLIDGQYTLNVSKAGFDKIDPVVYTISRQARQTANFSLTPLKSAIYGTVVDNDGGLKNVIIQIIDESTQTIVRRDTTNVGGIYSVSNLSVEKTYSVKAIKKGYDTGLQTKVSLGNESVVVDFLLEPVANSIFGQVKNQTTGLAAANARVKITGLEGGTWIDSTNSFGLYSVDGLASGTYTVIAQKDSLISASQTINLGSVASMKLNLELTQPGKIYGLVSYNSTGRGGASITASNVNSGALMSTVSDSTGHFEINGLLAGEYAVSCAMPGFIAKQSPQTARILTNEKIEANFELSAEANNVITGSITDTKSKALGSANVRLWNANFDKTTATDLNGQFQFKNLNKGTYSIRAELAGYTSDQLDNVELTGDELRVVDFQLAAILNSVSGIVNDANSGNPVQGATVTLVDTLGNVLSEQTDNSGAYLFSSVAQGDYLLKATKNGYKASAEVSIHLDTGKSVVKNLVVSPIFTTSTIAGKVYHKKTPLAEALVVISSLSDVEFAESKTTGSDGAFEFKDLSAPADYVLRVSKLGYPDLISPVIQLADRDTTYDFNFPSTQFLWNITKNGKITFPGVAIRLSNLKTDTLVVTDSEGNGQTKDNLKAGDYQVSLEVSNKVLSVKSYTVSIGEDTTVTENLYLPFFHEPVTSIPAKDAALLEVSSLITTIDTLWLHYKPIDSPGYAEPIMMQKNAAKSNSDTLYFSVEIPAQGKSGTVNYYMTSEYAGYEYSNSNNPYALSVTKAGIFSSLAMSPAQKNVPANVPVLLQVRAYDGINQRLTPESVKWQITAGVGELFDYATDSSYVWFKSSVDTVSDITSTVIKDGISFTGTARVITETRMLKSVSLSTTSLEVSNVDSLLFSYSAEDTSGLSMAIWPVWDYEPKNSGLLVPSLDGETAVYKPHANFLGQVKIYIKDNLTDTTKSFNSGDGINPADEGVKVYRTISEGNPGSELTDAENFYLGVPADAVNPGVQLKLRLRKPTIPIIKKLTATYETKGKIYDLNMSGQIKEGKYFKLKLPMPENVSSSRLRVGLWNLEEVRWDTLTHTIEGQYLTANVSELAQFAVLQESDPLGIREIRLLPNPFTPNDKYGLQFGFTLTSNDTRSPYMTIKVYNMAGELVRTVCENKVMPKGIYVPGSEGTLMWDGMTEHGLKAQNGRYLVLLEAKDNTGTKKELKTVVLIK